jgi:hypothetical protein
MNGVITTRFAGWVAVLSLSVACRNADSRASMDSELARDLELAGRTEAATPLGDTALSDTPKVAAGINKPAQTPRPVTVRPPRDESRATVEPLPAVQPEPVTPAAAPAPLFRGIPAGATLALTTKSQLCTTNLPGDKITATLTADVVGENGAVLPAGSTVVLEVAQVTPGDTPESAAISLRVRSVIVKDEAIAVPSDIAITSPLERRTVPRDKGADRKKVIGGVVAGAIVGQIMGKDTKSTVTGAVVGGAAGAAAAAASTKYDACLPAGATLRATTREPVPITATQ